MAAARRPRDTEETTMEFGYFTLSDNHYDNNPRDAEPVRLRHHRRGALRRPARHALGLDRRASFQFARRALLPRSRARLYRRAHQAHPARAGGHGDCRCTIRSASPSNGRRSTCSPTAASISPPAAATTSANTSRSTSSFADNQGIFEEGMEVVQKLWAADGPHLAPRQALFSSTTCASRRSRCRSRCPPMSARSPSPRSSSPRGSAAA